MCFSYQLKLSFPVPFWEKKSMYRLGNASEESILRQGYPLKLHFQIPCVFPVRPKIFPVPIYINCDYYINKTDLTDVSSFNKFWEFSRQILKYLLPLKSGNLQLEETKFHRANPGLWVYSNLPGHILSCRASWEADWVNPGLK